jgi:hypothetical protein
VSLLDCFLTADAAHVFTDGVLLNSQDNTIAGFASKVQPLAPYQAVVSVVGHGWITQLLASMVTEQAFDDFDALAADFARLVQDLIDRAARLPGLPPMDKFVAGLAGWSAQADAPAFVSVASFQRPEAVAFEPVRSTRFLQPAQTHAHDRSILDLKFNPADPEGSGLAIVRAQRAQRFTAWHDSKPCYGVGGFCQHTIVSRDAITMRVLERWPEDRIGAKIMPGAAPVSIIG